MKGRFYKMKIRNGEIKRFGEFLMSLQLDFKQTRKRIKLVQMLDFQLDYIQKSLDELVKIHAKKDENGDPIKIKEKNQLKFDVEDTKAYENDLKELLGEEFEIENSEANKVILQTIQEVVLNCVDPNRKFSNQEAFEYERWCKIVEDTINFDGQVELDQSE